MPGSKQDKMWQERATRGCGAHKHLQRTTSRYGMALHEPGGGHERLLELTPAWVRITELIKYYDTLSRSENTRHRWSRFLGFTPVR